MTGNAGDGAGGLRGEREGMGRAERDSFWSFRAARSIPAFARLPQRASSPGTPFRAEAPAARLSFGPRERGPFRDVARLGGCGGAGF